LSSNSPRSSRRAKYKDFPTYVGRQPNSRQRDAARSDGQTDWVRIVASHHPLVGRIVRLIRSVAREDGPWAFVELPDGRREHIPLTWTDLSTNGGTAMPALLLSPGSLRALVQLVRSLGMPSREETDHGDDPDHLGHPADRGARPHGGAVGRPAAPAPVEPQGSGGADAP
jgi:hypothetical protein